MKKIICKTFNLVPKNEIDEKDKIIENINRELKREIEKNRLLNEAITEHEKLTKDYKTQMAKYINIFIGILKLLSDNNIPQPQCHEKGDDKLKVMEMPMK